MSRNEWLNSFKLTERRYIPTTIASYMQEMRSISSLVSRRKDGKKFTTKLFTAISAGKLSDVRYLICVERVK